MKIDGRQYCDICYVELKPSKLSRPGQTLPPSLPALFGDRICQECDNAIVRKKPKAVPMHPKMRRYIRAVEAGKKPAPFTMSVTRGKITDHLPIPLTLAGKPKS